MQRSLCSVQDCERPTRTKSSPYCGMHYFRLYRHTPLGDATPRKRAKRNEHCQVPGCSLPDKESGYCSKHAARLRRHHDVHRVIGPNERDLPTGEKHHNWVGDLAGYTACHDRVRRLRGVASSHTCVDCGSNARHWSYNHDDPNEKLCFDRSSQPVAYSTSPEHYSPRCVSCHKKFDLQRIHATQFEHTTVA